MTPYPTIHSARTALDAVEKWAESCYLLRETESLRCGRLDGILVPTAWDANIKPGLTGIEVKISRADFLRGLKSGQFERYEEKVNAMFIVTTQGICKTAEVPVCCGHLIVGNRPTYGPTCVCRRKARRKQTDIPQDVLWRVLYDLFDQQERLHRKEIERLMKSVLRVSESIGDRVHAAVSKIINENEPRPVL
jgi:hypothetical protein